MGLSETLECAVVLPVRPLTVLARKSVRIEPLEPILGCVRDVAPDSNFFVERAEVLSVADGPAELMTAAGSLNHVDLEKILWRGFAGAFAVAESSMIFRLP